MIPSDVASRLQVTADAALRPVANIQEITDKLAGLAPGQRLMADIQALMPNGTYRALINQRDVILALPFSAKAGDSLELEVVSSDGKLTLALRSPPPGEGGKAHAESVPTTLSRTGQLIGSLFGNSGNTKSSPTLTPTALNGNQPIARSPPISAQDILPLLKQAITQSGLFYESHQAEWINGRFDKNALLQEPQGKLPPNFAPRATSASPLAQNHASALAQQNAPALARGALAVPPHDTLHLAAPSELAAALRPRSAASPQATPSAVHANLPNERFGATYRPLPTSLAPSGQNLASALTVQREPLTQGALNTPLPATPGDLSAAPFPSSDTATPPEIAPPATPANRRYDAAYRSMAASLGPLVPNPASALTAQREPLTQGVLSRPPLPSMPIPAAAGDLAATALPSGDTTTPPEIAPPATPANRQHDAAYRSMAASLGPLVPNPASVLTAQREPLAQGVLSVALPATPGDLAAAPRPGDNATPLPPTTSQTTHATEAAQAPTATAQETLTSPLTGTALPAAPGELAGAPRQGGAATASSTQTLPPTPAANEQPVVVAPSTAALLAPTAQNATSSLTPQSAPLAQRELAAPLPGAPPPAVPGALAAAAPRPHDDAAPSLANGSPGALTQSNSTRQSAEIEAKARPDKTTSSASQAAAQPAQLVAPPALPLVQQQLEALATQNFVWQGQVWPGQTMRWEIEEETKHQGGADSAADDGTASRWQTRLRLTLPNLGEVDAQIKLQGHEITLALTAGSTETQSLLRNATEFLRSQLGEAGLALSSLGVGPSKES
jgi:hypothetical protein